MAVKLAIAGASGRMGRMLIEAALKDESVKLVAALEQEGSTFLGRDAGEFVGTAVGVPIGTDADAALALADCLIDFTRPEATLKHLDAAIRANKAIVIGTTGFDAAGKAAIAAAGARIPVVFAPSMAVGVNAVFKLLEVAARILAEGYDVEVIEAHHRYKVDAPSGTALRMGEVVARAQGLNLEAHAIYGREGVTGERPAKQIGFSTIRGGDIVGDHTVLFAGLGERVEITHRSSNRMNFAVGALRAARFLHGRVAGAYDMQDVLGLK
ncbi:MAG: 4-hydroxy-tetrahydrodipicolinate reductase [Betaproteobacteria bacterium]|nr:4-hydroxy-tetrahydrodipicolinate reductase [Betaproteobacteria bacterium]